MPVLQEGQNLGPYRILSQLGSGGMATVFKAYHPKLDRYVALKIMHQAFQQDSTFIARFEREAQIVARLHHPHIVPVFDYSEHDGQLYLVMKFIEGQTLKARRLQNPLGLDDISRMMTTIAEALTFAHNAGVLHRDIKPSNILIDNDDVPYLTDFGLARIAEAGESTLSQDMLLGTPHYISPEQAKGIRSLDARTDIYSFGVVLYELIVGRVPFSADTPYAIIHDHIYTPLPLPSMVNPSVPPRVEQVLLKALAKDPIDRYDSAVEMIEAFRDAISTANLKELRTDYISVKTASQAKQHETVNLADVSSHSIGIPAPISASAAARKSIQQPRQRNSWVWIGFIGMLTVCILSAAVSMNAADTLREIAAFSDAIETATAAPAESTGNTAIASDDNLDQAQAYWREGDLEAAQNALIDGASESEQPIRYLLQAAELAEQDEALQTAAGIYVYLLNQNGIDNTMLRERAGEFLYYHVALNPDISLPGLRAFENVEDIPINGQLPLLGSIAARIMIRQNQVRRAELLLNFIVNSPIDELPETHLIRGELYQAQRSAERAEREWQLAANTADAPQWVVDRANELLSAN